MLSNGVVFEIHVDQCRGRKTMFSMTVPNFEQV